MISRRDLGLGALAGLAALQLAALPASATDMLSEAEARAALEPWAAALFSGDPAQVEKVLAPEYQILRSNGVGFNKDEYLSNLPKQSKLSVFSQIQATGNGQILVARYLIETEQTIDGVAVNGVSPRLSVFRKEGDSWLMVSHANFAQLT